MTDFATIDPADVNVGDTICIRDHMGQEHEGEVLAKSDVGICAFSELNAEEIFWYMHGYGSRWIIRVDNSKELEKIKSILDDALGGVFYYDRKEDNDMFPGRMEHLVHTGVVSIDEIIPFAAKIIHDNLSTYDEEMYNKWKDMN